MASPPDHDQPQALDLIDPDDWTADQDAVRRARAERRRAREAARSGRGDAHDGAAIHAPADPAPVRAAHRRRLGLGRAPAASRAVRAPFAALGLLGGSRSGRILIAAAALLLVATIAGLVALWPGERPERGPSQAFGGAALQGSVTRALEVECEGPVAQRCRAIDVRLDEGRGRGRTSRITLGPVESVPAVGAGDRVRVRATGAPAATKGAERYGFVDVDRRGSILWLAIAFTAIALVFARWRGLLSLAGFALSLLLVTKFLVPAILAGSSPLLVAVVGSLAVMFVTLGLTYGVAPASLAAALGIAASLGLAAVLAHVWVGLAHLDGRGSELSTVLSQQNASLSLQGVVLAGMVIGALGVLADTGVTQASAVMALRRANPSLGAGAVYREAFAVGRDHLTATIHTLVLAYVGASLPLILILSSAHVATGDALNAQALAEPIVATLVGSIALLASVPLTTGLAALLASRIPADSLAGGHEHHHHH
ncbi:MAG: hypothetical protein QOJ21_2512 [Solirubrobacteraceae bacterium]|nr:hypothetical protein [Solirubrobacteraceae bacterium]